MARGFLRLIFIDDSDGTGKLCAEAVAEGFSGRRRAYFDLEVLKRFAGVISEYPLPDRRRCQINSGFLSKGEQGKLQQEHLGIDVYPIDGRGHIGVQIRLATQLWQGSRTDSQKTAKLEVITTYEPLRKFSADLLALLNGNIDEVRLDDVSTDGL